jgi:hypothetical protein
MIRYVLNTNSILSSITNVRSIYQCQISNKTVLKIKKKIYLKAKKIKLNK